MGRLASIVHFSIALALIQVLLLLCDVDVGVVLCVRHGAQMDLVINESFLMENETTFAKIGIELR